MNLIKANLHMDRNKYLVNTRIILEEDKNISERNPDAVQILMEKAELLFEEIHPGKDQLHLSGRLPYEILYLAEGGRLCRLSGEIPFEERLHVQGMEAMDEVEVSGQIEDLRTALINSRKLSIRALVRLNIRNEEIYDEVIPVDLEPAQGVEVRKQKLSQSIVAVDRKDILRIREELELPAALPPAEEVLWECLKLRKWEIRPLENSISVQGELQLFLLYEARGEERSVKCYETMLPFGSNLDCPGSKPGMQVQILPSLGMNHLSVKEDYDGEKKKLEAEAVLNLPIRLLECAEWETVTDVYSSMEDVSPVYETGNRRVIQNRYQGKIKRSEHFSPTVSSDSILQVCYVDGTLTEPEVTVDENGMEIAGAVSVTVLYLTGEEGKPYGTIKGEIPYSYYLEQEGICDHHSRIVIPVLEQCKGILLDESHVEVKIQMSLEVSLEERWQEPVITELEIQPLSPQKLSKMPGMVVYFAAGGEELWEVGKKYLTALEPIRNLNQLSCDTLEKGQKILIVKEVG